MKTPAQYELQHRLSHIVTYIIINSHLLYLKIYTTYINLIEAAYRGSLIC